MNQVQINGINVKIDNTIKEYIKIENETIQGEYDNIKKNIDKINKTKDKKEIIKFEKEIQQSEDNIIELKKDNENNLINANQLKRQLEENDENI